MSATTTIHPPIQPFEIHGRREVSSGYDGTITIPATLTASDIPQIDSRPTVELIVERQMLTAVLLPRELTQAQLLIAEFLVKGHWRLRVDLASVWQQWRVYAAPFWLACPEATQPQKPTGSKLFFA